MSTQLDSQSDTTSPKPKNLFPPKVRVALALLIIGFFVVISFFLPSEGDSNNVTGDPVNVTVVVTHPMDSISVNRSVDFNGVHITITQVEEAAKFSDDRKPGGNYVVRVHLQERNTGQNVVGIDYATLATLRLPGGEEIEPKLVGLSPAVLPNQVETGYIDFPVATPLSLSSLTLRLGDTSGVAFGP
jgi:hypothetical protein